jgi:Domain of unknown function (DUF6046)
MNEFNISQAYKQAFGVERGQSFSLPAIATADNNAFLRIRNLLNVKLLSGASVFMPLKIGDFVFPNEPTIDVSSRKHIVETVLANANGTVKELISTGDYELTIRGIALNQASKVIYPEALVRDLNALYKRREALEIVCALTELLGIRRIVIKDFRLPSMVGVQHAQAYEFVVLSDHEFILNLK